MRMAQRGAIKIARTGTNAMRCGIMLEIIEPEVVYDDYIYYQQQVLKLPDIVEHYKNQLKLLETDLEIAIINKELKELKINE